jgi:signal transduction histidine kinase
MTAFGQQPHVAAEAEFESNLAQPVKRPSRLSMSNWPVRWKVFAIVLVPLLLAGAFGGLRVYSGWTDAADLKLAADRAGMVPAVNEYASALEGAMLANSTGGDPQSALAAFDSSKQNLQRHLADTNVLPDVAKGVTALLDGGQALLDKVTANSITLRDRITTYTPILLTAEDVVTGSVRVEDEQIRAETQGLSRAMGARGQMMMQQLLVNLGAELPEPELRTSMITVAGTEPSTLFGMAQVLGVGSPEAQKLQAEFVTRMGMMSDPTVPLVNNPELSQSIQTTNEIALKLIDSTKSAVAANVADQASVKRSEAIRDSAIVGAAILIALLIVTLVARSLVRPLRRLRDGALKVAHEDLARELERVRAGGAPGPVQPLPVHSSEEIGQVAHAVDELHEQAVLLAGEQVNLQMQVDDMFETLSRRNRSLVDQQLTLIDGLERDEEDPQRLESLFRLDHLAARMRRNGANLMVLAGSKVPREQADPVPVAAIINAAASEVEDYARIVTASVPDSEVLGAVAGDLVHLLAEILDNALRYSPPISQVRVSAVHTGNGGLVFEVSDIGLGMTDSDLRVANVRLQSGGEVNPYTARHMGLFVVGRLAAQHGLIVRLRSTVSGEPNSGTTAGIFLPEGLLLEQSGGYHDTVQDYAVPADAHAGITTALALDHEQSNNGEYSNNGGEYSEYDDYEADYGAGYGAEPEYRNGHVDIPVSLLPQRNPGASGISGIPSLPPEPVVEPESDWADEDEWPADSMPAQTPAEASGPPPPPQPQRPGPSPSDTSAFFASRHQVPNQYAPPSSPSNGVPSNGVPSRPMNGVPSQPPPPSPRAAPNESAATRAEAPESEPSGSTDSNSIFNKMLSEWLIDDPIELANSTDLDWQTVWDHGWSAAAAAEEVPVEQHTEHGLPMREPGARLVPGAADAASKDGNGNGRHRNGDAEAERADTGTNAPPSRDPEAVRSSISEHFGGVHAGRTRAKESRETDQQ